MSVGRSLYERFAKLVHEVAKFGTVGLLAYVIDTGTFNLLKYDGGPVSHKVITDKIISTSLAATFAYFANRHWTWRARARTRIQPDAKAETGSGKRRDQRSARAEGGAMITAPLKSALPSSVAGASGPRSTPCAS